jgi:hypothetical protein
MIRPDCPSPSPSQPGRTNDADKRRIIAEDLPIAELALDEAAPHHSDGLARVLAHRISRHQR